MRDHSLHKMKKLLLIAFFLLLLQTTAQTDTIMAANTVIAVDPHTSTANPGEYFTVYVNITDVEDLYSWAFKLRWPTALLKFVSATEVTTFFNGDFTYNSGLNYVAVGSSILADDPTVSGSGTLVSIRLQVRERTGNCTLELDDTVLYDDDLYLIAHTASDGYFYTTYPVAEFTYVPDPSVADEYYGRPIVGETVTFNATESYDPDQAYKEQAGRGIVSYEWSFGGEDTDTGMIVEHEYTEAGQYEAKLTVTDDDGETDEEIYPAGGMHIFLHDIAVINVTVTNDSPEVMPGQKVYVNATVLNQGTDTEHINVTLFLGPYSLNTTLFHYVEYMPPPSPPHHYYSLEAGKNATTTISCDTTGVPGGRYTVNVTAFLVHDVNSTWVRPDYPIEQDLSDNTFTDDEVTILAHDIAITNVTASTTHATIGDDVDINVTVTNEGDFPESFDVTTYYDEAPVAPTQTVTDLAAKANKTLYFTWDTTGVSKGTYTISANASVVLNETDTADNTLIGDEVTVRLPGDPVADFTYLPDEPLVNEKVMFNASSSTPDGGTIVSYEWDFGDETTEIYVDANLTDISNHTYTKGGPYTVTLNVTDSEGKWATASKSITVYASPVANFTYLPSEPVVGDLVTFNASSSYDPDGGTIVSYDWDFDDETTDTGNVTTHTYTETGTYTVTLNVTDNDGLIGTATADVTVSTPSLIHDVAVTSVTPNPTVVAPGQYVSVTVIVENQGDYAETFNVTAYYDTNTIGMETTTVESNATKSITFTWNTAVVAEGTYTISAEADEVPDETDLEDNTYIDDTVTVVRQVGPGQTLSIEFSGEREYFEDEDVKIRLVALVRYADTMMPASNANVTIRIFNSEGELWVSDVMVEKLTGTGIYEWESIDTIAELELEKGFYLIHVQARLGGLEASGISQFHIATVEKTTSIISIDVNPNSVSAGSSITLTGAITPKRSGVTVTIHHRGSGGTWSELRTLTTSTTGHYSLGWVVTTAGTYEVKASWPGDTRTEGAESEVKTVTVQETSWLPLEIPPYVTIAIAAIVGSIVGSIIGTVVLMRIRKPKPP